MIYVYVMKLLLYSIIIIVALTLKGYMTIFMILMRGGNDNVKCVPY